MKTRWMLCLLAGLLVFSFHARPSRAACCVCDCAPVDLCLDTAENECSDACGNQNPSCGVIGFSPEGACTPSGCVQPSAVPVASSRTLLLLGAALAGLGGLAMSRRRRAASRHA